MQQLREHLQRDEDSQLSVRVELSADSWLEYLPRWLDEDMATALASSLRSQLVWEQREIVLFGRSILQPRLIAWGGQLPYRYSGQTLEPRVLSPELELLRERVQRHTKQRFNHALVNRYRNGDDSMGFHSDAEPELGEHPVVASLSLGAPRRFVIEAKRGADRRALDLTHGSLLVMGGRCQSEFRHGVPKTRAPVAERINVTWRHLLRPPDASG